MKRLYKPSCIVCLLLSVALFPGLYLLAQERTQSQDRRQPPTLRATTDAILVDLVVRDKRGRPVRDLKIDEIEIFEDGKKQEIISFTPIERGALALPGGPGIVRETESRVPKAAWDQPRQINLVTLVFEGLGPDGRKLGREAALDFLENELQPNTFVAVFSVDQRLFILQQFTTDRELLRQAVEQATSGTFTQFVSRSDAIQVELQRLSAMEAAAESAATPIGQAPPGDVPQLGGNIRELLLARMSVNILQYAELLERDHQGRTSVFALLSLVREQRRLAGRKTVVYLSEGLHVPPNVVENYRTLISEANRANVSVYAVDARGLMTGGLMSSTRDLLNQTAAQSRSQVTRLGGPVSRDDVMVSESAEAALRTNTQQTLADLASSTGGFLIANTNDLREGIKQVVEDIGYYYELAYVPKSMEYDGKFRHINVRVSRPDVSIQSRSGYFALPSSESAPTFPYETPMLIALNNLPPPKDFSYSSAALRFGHDSDGTQYSLVMEVPLAHFSFQQNKEKNQYSTRFSLLALVKDAQGKIVQKFSQDYPLEGPLEKLESLKKGNVIFLRHFRLSSGRYTVETVAHDQQTTRTSVRRSILVVPAPQPGIQMSSLLVIRQADAVAATSWSDADNPLRYENVRIVPNLGEPISKEPNAALSLFAVIYPDDNNSEKPELNVLFLRDGQVIARGTPALPAPDAGGRIPYVANVPLSTFQAGQYEVVAVVQQGQSATQERTFFTINQ